MLIASLKGLAKMFQFPSNGKAYPKLIRNSKFSQKIFSFQFPSNGKAYPKLIVGVQISRLQVGFNSLQTGKPIQRQLRIRTFHVKNRFNSLQTGKPIQRDPILSPVGPWLRTPKTKRELCGAIFERNFSPKIS